MSYPDAAWERAMTVQEVLLKAVRAGESGRGRGLFDKRETVAGASADGAIRVWRLAAHAVAASFKGHVAGVTGVAFSPDEAVLASVGKDGTMKLWDVMGGRELAAAVVAAYTRRLDIDSDDEPLLRDVAYSRDGTLLAVAAGDGRIRVWRVSGGALREIATLHGHTAAVNDLSFSPDGRTLASASDDHTVKL